MAVCHKRKGREKTKVATLLLSISFLFEYSSFQGKKMKAVKSPRGRNISLSTTEIKLVLFYHAQICLDLSSGHSSCCQYLLMIITSNTILAQ